ncbi:MAG TPA: ADOP family duplicated permease [Candidatus Acidoferrales bacterium]|nr:ADOP family duplicated permease [Candidatus Acidoferrales bacterium]
MMDGFGIEVRPLMQDEVGDVSQPLYLLLGAVLLVLLIACANVANLLLARGSLRAREMAIRAAIGAGRRRIIALLLTESVLLSLPGGALGLLFAWWGILALIHFAPASLPHANTISLDSAVLGFAFVVSMLAGIFFGFAPAMQAGKIDLNDSLKENARSGASSSAHPGLRRALILSEVALTFVLLVGAGLLLRSFARLLDVNPGFNPVHLLTLEISPSQQVSAAQTGWQSKSAAFSRNLLARVSAMPGVLHAALSDGPPLMHPDNSIFLIRDYHFSANGPQPHADDVSTSPGYFATMGIPLLYGRVYTDEDIQTKNHVVVVDQALANRFWPGQSALGKQIGWDSKGPWNTIIGVVGAVRSHTLARETKGTLYFPAYYPGMSLVVRSASNPGAIAGAIREQLEKLDPTQAVYSVKTMGERVSESVAQQRFASSLLALFAALALALAAVGLYGVMAYIVAQRTHEIGIRMALGAQRGDVLRLVIGQGARLTLAGIATGVVAAIGLTRLMASLLYGVTPTDPMTFIGVAIVLAGVALLACYVPARRAMRVDPMVALRYE